MEETLLKNFTQLFEVLPNNMQKITCQYIIKNKKPTFKNSIISLLIPLKAKIFKPFDIH